ncbi:MAG: hypothetical protein J6Y60_03365 [Treponema sp.]|nr:hypothetical protein [Treponema sp.]
MPDRQETVRRLSVLHRYLFNYNAKFFDEAVNKKAFCDVLMDAIILIQNTGVIQNGSNNHNVVNNGTLNIDVR